jgi:hypothetical protein
MRELEFLPAWYATLRQKQRILVIEAWLAMIVAVTLGLWMILSARNVLGKQTLLSTREKQLTQSNYELQKLGELESLKRQMSDQAKLMAHVGLNVPMARLVEALEKMMPKEMALLDVTVESQEQPNAQPKGSFANAESNRHFLVTLHGVSPSVEELGNFMIHVAAIPNYVEGSVKTSDVHQNGHRMTDFKISFGIRLNDPEN